MQSLAEPAINAVKISFFAAIVIAFPILVYQIWQFVTPGLQRNERRAGWTLTTWPITTASSITGLRYRLFHYL